MLLQLAHYHNGKDQEICILYNESQERTYVMNTENMTLSLLPFYENDIMTEILRDYNKENMIEVNQCVYDYFVENIDDYDLSESDQTWLLENIGTFE